MGEEGADRDICRPDPGRFDRRMGDVTKSINDFIMLTTLLEYHKQITPGNSLTALLTKLSYQFISLSIVEMRTP